MLAFWILGCLLISWFELHASRLDWCQIGSRSGDSFGGNPCCETVSFGSEGWRSSLLKSLADVEIKNARDIGFFLQVADDVTVSLVVFHVLCFPSFLKHF